MHQRSSALLVAAMLTACGGKALDGAPGSAGAPPLVSGMAGAPSSASGGPNATSGASSAGAGAGAGGASVAGAAGASAGSAGQLCASDVDCEAGRFCGAGACRLKALQIAAGEFHTCVSLSDGTARCWGRNADGQLGNGHRAPSTPVVVSGLADRWVTSIAAGGRTSCVTLGDSTVRCWGRGSDGQLGIGSLTSTDVPVAVPDLISTSSVTLGQFHGCALSTIGEVRCWGRAAFGQGGSATGPGESLSMPLIPEGRLFSGYDDSCASSGQALWCWTRTGRVASEDVPMEPGPTPFPFAAFPGRTLVDFAVGRAHLCAVFDDGSVHCWGDNASLQLGSLGITQSQTPLPVIGIPVTTGRAVAVSAGGFHSCALFANREVRCWGAELSFGAGVGTLSAVPHLVPALNDDPEQPVRIVSGNSHSCALMSNGSVRCWGFATENELGTLDPGVHGSALRVAPW